jgi:LmbE family N-acetylglucosaminyl deacetylase
MSDLLSARLQQAAAEGRGLLFLAPHLDDAVLSCGALLSSLAERYRITVATVFSAAGPPPHTRAARIVLRQCGADDAAELYAIRRKEDAAVLSTLGIEPVHLGVPDAIFRRREVGPVLARLGDVVPEVVHRYPTFRLDIAKGLVSRGDRGLLDSLKAQVDALMARVNAQLVFAPIGVGRHVDHLLTRSLGERYAGRVVHYSDFPYDQGHLPDAAYLAAGGVEPVTWSDGLDRKLDLIRGYRTQLAPLFPSGEIPLVPETYYLPARGRPRT